jgi:hypothetical protein
MQLDDFTCCKQLLQKTITLYCPVSLPSVLKMRALGPAHCVRGGEPHGHVVSTDSKKIVIADKFLSVLVVTHWVLLRQTGQTSARNTLREILLNLIEGM